jgi:general secretion pathway protein C
MMLSLLTLVLLAAPPDISLRGVVVSERPEARVAVLQSAGRTRVAAVGETAFGGRILEVTLDSATLLFDGQETRLRLAAAPLMPAGPARSAPARADEPPEDPDTPAQTMSRKEVDQRLTLEMNRILSETALVPVLDEGRVNGVAITRIASGSLLTDAGLRAGDVLKEINGTEIDGLATLMGLYSRLQSEKELRAVVLRQGKPISVRITLK